MKYDIGKSLVAMRNRRDLSQQEFADLISQYLPVGKRWHQTTVYRSENGERNLLAYEAEAIARCFGITIEEFLTGRPLRLPDVARQSLLDVKAGIDRLLGDYQ